MDMHGSWNPVCNDTGNVSIATVFLTTCRLIAIPPLKILLRRTHPEDFLEIIHSMDLLKRFTLVPILSRYVSIVAPFKLISVSLGIALVA